jgi:hypothetical protein
MALVRVSYVCRRRPWHLRGERDDLFAVLKNRAGIEGLSDSSRNNVFTEG